MFIKLLIACAVTFVLSFVTAIINLVAGIFLRGEEQSSVDIDKTMYEDNYFRRGKAPKAPFPTSVIMVHMVCAIMVMISLVTAVVVTILKYFNYIS